MSLCSRCGMNEPLPLDPDDFCADCALDAEAILAALTEHGEGPTGPVVERGIVRDSVLVDRLDWNSRAGVTFSCDPCECGGNPDCERCNG